MVNIPDDNDSSRGFEISSLRLELLQIKLKLKEKTEELRKLRL